MGDKKMEAMEALDTTPAKPKKRNGVKAGLYNAGYDSIKDFSRKSGINYSVVWSVIKGERFPSPETQRRIAKALNLNLAQLKKLL
jgi:hypothetical protein